MALSADPDRIQAEKLLKVGQELVEKTYYLEALDLLQEARDLLETSGDTQDALYGDVLSALAETKIKGRLHQSFPAQYVKTALKDIQTANKLRERRPDSLPQKLGDGFFLEGFILKKFFMRTEDAIACFRKAVKIDPGNGAAKRELSELLPAEEAKSR